MPSVSQGEGKIIQNILYSLSERNPRSFIIIITLFSVFYAYIK